MEIRRSEESDRPLIQELMTECLIDEYGTPPDLHNIDFLLDYYFSRPDSIIFCLWENEREFCGFIWLIESQDSVSGEKFYLALYLGIPKHCRGKKYSRKLFQYAIDYCRENHIKELRLSVRHDNIPAINLHHSMGFETYKHEMKLKL